MRIAYFSGSLKKNLDGVSRVLYRISEYNKEHNIESVFISPETDSDLDNQQIALKGVRLPLYKEYKLSLSSKSFIKRRLQEINFVPDLIHVHSPCTTGLAGLKLAKQLQIPLVATYHTHFPSYLEYHRAEVLKDWVQRYLNYFYNQCDVVLVPSSGLQKELAALGIPHSEVLPHGVDTHIFNRGFYSDALKQSAGEKKILLFAGRLVWEKNLRMLSQAVDLLAQKRNDFVVWVAGTGPAEAAFKNELKHATFFGFCESEKLASLYATSDVFVFPSATETFGNVTLEAMACGTCCVVANARGSADLITHEKNGLLVEPGNAGALAKQIEFLLDNVHFRNLLAEEAHRNSGNYKWNTLLKRQSSIYEACLYQHKTSTSNIEL